MNFSSPPTKDKGSDAIKVYRANGEIVADHGRLEESFIEVMGTEKLQGVIDSRWRDLNSIARISYTNTEPTTGEIIIERRHLISSLAPYKPEKFIYPTFRTNVGYFCN